MTLSEYTMHGTKKNTGKFFSIVFTVALIGLVTAAIIPGVAGVSTVNLGAAGNYTILAKSAISTTGTTSVAGDIGISPAAATYITGFGLTLDSSGQFSTSSLVTGKVYAADYTAPTPDDLTRAVSNMEAAYTDASTRSSPDYTDIGSGGEIGGLTLAPGLYKFTGAVTISTDVILNGSASDVWIFQIPGALSISSGKHVILNGGAQAQNIFWEVGGATTLGTTSVFNGNILDFTAITLNNGATLNGRALAQTAVTLDADTLSVPTATPTPTPTPTVTETPSIEISITGTESPWALTPGTPYTENNVLHVVVTSTADWAVAASDADTTNTKGFMTDWTGSAYVPGTKLAHALQVNANGGTYVTLPSGGSILTGTAGASGVSYPLGFRQEVTYADPVLPGPHVYRIVVTLTGTTV
jgi:hypothetical protein